MSNDHIYMLDSEEVKEQPDTSKYGWVMSPLVLVLVLALVYDASAYLRMNRLPPGINNWFETDSKAPPDEQAGAEKTRSSSQWFLTMIRVCQCRILLVGDISEHRQRAIGCGYGYLDCCLADDMDGKRSTHYLKMFGKVQVHCRLCQE